MSSTTMAVVPADENEFIMTDEERTLLGLDEFDQSDMIIPRVRLAQPTSQLGDASPGQFHNNLTGEAADAVTFIVIRSVKGRVLWPEGFERGQKPTCASDDSKKPREGGQYPGPCAECPAAQWGENHEAPACTLHYNYLAVDTASGLPFMASMARMSAKTAKQIITLLQTWGPSHALTATSEKVKTDKGTWYEWRIRDGGKVANPRQYFGIARSFSGRAVTVDTGEDEPGLVDTARALGGIEMEGREEIPF